MILGLGVPEMLVILIVVLIIFGPKNLSKLGTTLGKTVKNVREGMEEEDEPSSKPSAGNAPKPQMSETAASTTAAGASSQAPAAFCSHCGSPLEAGAAFCPHCGARVAEAAAEPETPADDEPVMEQQEEAAEKVSA